MTLFRSKHIALPSPKTILFEGFASKLLFYSRIEQDCLSKKCAKSQSLGYYNLKHEFQDYISKNKFYDMLFKIVIFLPETTSKYLSILTKNAPERSLINKVFHDS